MNTLGWVLLILCPWVFLILYLFDEDEIFEEHEEDCQGCTCRKKEGIVD